MGKFTVRQRGVDTSGRPIFMTDYMHAFWETVVDELGFRPTIVQGAWMARAGGGAPDSAGYHDKAGCLDLRTWDQTEAQNRRVIYTTRRHGAGSWIRDEQRGGMDPHIHLVLGGDEEMASGATIQWADYKAGGNGLTGSSAGADYHPAARPKPLVTSFDYRAWLRGQEDDKDMNENQAKLLRETHADVQALRKGFATFREAEVVRDKAFREGLQSIAADLDKADGKDATIKRLRERVASLLQKLDEATEA